LTVRLREAPRRARHDQHTSCDADDGPERGAEKAAGFVSSAAEQVTAEAIARQRRRLVASVTAKGAEDHEAEDTKSERADDGSDGPGEESLHHMLP